MARPTGALRKEEVSLLLADTREALKQARNQRLTPKKQVEIARLETIERLARELQRVQHWA